MWFCFVLSCLFPWQPCSLLQLDVLLAANRAASSQSYQSFVDRLSPSACTAHAEKKRVNTGTSRTNGNGQRIGVSPTPRFMGLSLHFQKVDHIDAAAWEKIDRQEGRRAQV